MKSRKTRVAVIGTGNIGTDLVERILKDPSFEVVAIVGRRPESPGLRRFDGRVEHVLDSGIAGLSDFWSGIDGVFDATSATGHAENWPVIRAHGKWAIDLTPSREGAPFVPVLKDQVDVFRLQSGPAANYSMVTCGGQSSAPLISALTTFASDVQEVEVSSSIASLSAGPATRDNLDEYIDATENMTRLISGCNRVKSILVLNPASPPVMMRTTVTVKARSFAIDEVRARCDFLIGQVKKYVPGYDLVVSPHFLSDNVMAATVKVEGAGHFLPTYAGNLDIINAAAVETARLHQATLVTES